MALALILRNTPKIQAKGLSQNFLKTSSFIVCRDLSSLSQPQYLNSQNKLNLTLTLPQTQILTAPQVRLMSSDHSKLWPLEKAVSVGLLVLVPAAIVSPNVVFDNLLAVASVIHFHWGLEAVVVDYVRPIIVGNILPKVSLGLLYLISALTLGGLIYYNINDIGIGRTIKRFWSIGKGEPKQKEV